MKAYDLVELAGRNLREALLRNILTTAGISVGVASLVAMLSLGIGLQKLANQQLGRSGLFETVIVSSRQDFRNAEDRRTDPNRQTADLRPLDDAARAEFRQLPGVVDVYPDIRLMSELRFSPDGVQPEKTHFSMMAALPSTANGSEVFDELQGGFFSGPNAKEAILLNEFAFELLNVPDDGKPQEKRKLTTEQLNSLLGKEITLRYAVRKPVADARANPQASIAATGGAATDDFDFTVVREEIKLKIVGVVNDEPYGGFRSGALGRVYIPTELAEGLNMIQPTDLRAMMRPSQGKSYFSLVVRMAKATQVRPAQDAIRKLGFNTFSVLDAAKNMRKFFAVLDLFLGIFGSLALSVASLGIINTLVMATLERRREIGIMKALGASDLDVKQLFFVEAGSMGVIGGLQGIALGWIIGRTINFGANMYLQRQGIDHETFWYLPWWLVAAALAFAVVVSLLSGLYPASRAAKLDPVQALRHD